MAIVMVNIGMDDVYRLNDSNFVVKKMGDEMIIIPLVNTVADMTKVITINEVGCSIFEQLDGKTSLLMVLMKLLKIYNVAKEQLEADILLFIEEALEKQLIEKVALLNEN